jgi:hypothetical protein
LSHRFVANDLAFGACAPSANGHRQTEDDALMNFEITKKDLVDWSTAGLVFFSGAMSGHYAAVGMGPVQWAGSAAAVLGSVAVAVAVRVWPPKAAPVRSKD